MLAWKLLLLPRELPLIDLEYLASLGATIALSTGAKTKLALLATSASLEATMIAMVASKLPVTMIASKLPVIAW